MYRERDLHEVAAIHFERMNMLLFGPSLLLGAIVTILAARNNEAEEGVMNIVIAICAALQTALSSIKQHWKVESRAIAHNDAHLRLKELIEDNIKLVPTNQLQGGQLKVHYNQTVDMRKEALKTVTSNGFRIPYFIARHPSQEKTSNQTAIQTDTREPVRLQDPVSPDLVSALTW
jgi:hypothetical protein